jgi:hypothetical protein
VLQLWKIKNSWLSALELPLNTPSFDWEGNVRNYTTLRLLPNTCRSMHFLGNCFFLAFFLCLLAHRCLLFPPAQSSFMWPESMTQFLSDHSFATELKNDCFAMSHTLTSHEGHRDNWLSLFHGISLKTLMIWHPKWPPLPFP